MSRPKPDATHFLSVLAALFALAVALAGCGRGGGNTSAASPWTRFALSDSSCSAEFPAEPTRISDLAVKGGESLNASVNGGQIDYILSVSERVENAPKLTAEERYDEVRNRLPAIMAAGDWEFELTHEEQVTQDGVVGRRLQYNQGKTLLGETRMFVVGQRLYRAILTVKRDLLPQADSDRFFGSIRLERNSQ